MIVEDFTFEAPKTKDLFGILSLLKISDKKILLILPEKNENLYKSGRNIPKLDVQISDKVATYQLLNNGMILLQKSAIENLCKSLS